MSEWISIKDRYPDPKDGWVIVSVIDCHDKTRDFPRFAFWDVDEWIDEDDNDFECQDSVRVTHWMSLPDPPKE